MCNIKDYLKEHTPGHIRAEFVVYRINAMLSKMIGVLFEKKKKKIKSLRNGHWKERLDHESGLASQISTDGALGLTCMNICVPLTDFQKEIHCH